LAAANETDQAKAMMQTALSENPPQAIREQLEELLKQLAR